MTFQNWFATLASKDARVVPHELFMLESWIAAQAESQDIKTEVVHLRVAVDQTMAARNELQRRLTEILDMIDGREDIDNDGGPNIFMRIAMTARGEDRP